MNMIDWPVLMRAALCRLRLRPAEFWALTPAELELLLTGSGNAAPLNRAGLDGLLAAFPDTKKGT